MDYKQVSLKDVHSSVNKDIPLMFDTETIGLYGRIRLAQFFQKGWEQALLVEYPDPMEMANMLYPLHIVMHNSHYDITTIQQHSALFWLPENFDDTFLLSRLHFPTQEGFSLDKVVKYVTGEDPYSGNDQQKSDWGVLVLSEDQKKYAAIDVIYLDKVYDAVIAQKTNYSYKLDLLTTRYCLVFQNNGVPVDVTKLKNRLNENNKQIAEIALPINCNSFQQVRKFICAETSDDEGLAKLSLAGNRNAALVRATRKITKNNSFIRKYLSELEDNEEYSVMYGKFKCSARSGRLTSSDENLQQIPRSLKDTFGVREGGNEVIIFSDFAQIQLRNVCVLTNAKRMEKLFREGEDLHGYVAKMLFGPDFTKEQRQISKTANFGLLFGAGIAVFQAILIKQAGIWLSDNEAKEIKDKWLSLWSEIASWQKQGIRDWKAKRAWKTPLGREYVAKMMTDQLAMQIQGFEAEVAKLAMHYMLPKLEKLDPEIKLRLFIHDSYIFTAPNEEEIYTTASNIVAASMQEAWFEMCKNAPIPDLPMPVNVKIGWNWGDIENGIFTKEFNY